MVMSLLNTATDVGNSADDSPAVLVVDDSPGDRHLIGSLLSRAGGWHVLFASNGVEALEVLKRGEPAVVLTDMLMPEMDGLELVEIVRRQYPLVPTVLMTAFGNEELAIKALQRGAASYVPKKNVAECLVDTLDQVLASSRSNRQQRHLLECVSRTETEFELANDPFVVPALVAYLQDQADGFQLYDQTGRTRLGIALEEAILNGIHHGNLELNSELREGGDEPYRRLAGERARTPPYSDRRLRLRATLSTAEAVFVIADDGPGFDPASLPDPTDPANLGRAFGRGLLLIRTFMDEVTFTPPGNQITLVKRRDGARGKTSCTS